MKTVAIGIIGTSWWADSMYLPAIAAHPQASVAALCGRNRERAEVLAARWGVGAVYTDYREMLASDGLDAVIIAAANDIHHPAAMAALERGLHVLCEKPLARTVAEAEEMTALAAAKSAVTMVPFTYRFMPSVQYVKALIDDGYIGTPRHLSMRYYTGFGRSGDYHWRFDRAVAGSGVIGDLGSHFLHLADWLYGGVDAITATATALVDRPDADAEDTATMLLEFANGAHGVITVTAIAHEPGGFGQRHLMEFHGTAGTLHLINDWQHREEIHGAQAGDTTTARLAVPGISDNVHDTYRDVFRKHLKMTGDWVTAITTGGTVAPDFGDGLRVQRMMDAALRSAAEGRRVTVAGGDGDIC